MLGDVCCGVHENLYCAIICVILISTGYVSASLFACWYSLTWYDLAAYGIWFLLLVALGGRLLLLNAAFSKDLYDETPAYAELLLQEKPALESAFPVIHEIVDPERNLWRMDQKTIPVKVVCSRSVTELQCREIMDFIRSRIRSMGGTPFADLELSIWIPAPKDSAENRMFFSGTISRREQKELQNFPSWVAKAFPVHSWLGTTALLMAALLASSAGFLLFREKNQELRLRRFLFSGFYCAAAVLFFGGFFLLNRFLTALLYCRMLTLFVLPYALVVVGCWGVRFFRRKRIPDFSADIAFFFILASVLTALFLLTVDSAGSGLW